MNDITINLIAILAGLLTMLILMSFRPKKQTKHHKSAEFLKEYMDVLTNKKYKVRGKNE